MKYKKNGTPICENNEEFWNEISKVWDYEKNEKHWSEYNRCSVEKVWLRCDKTDYHDSYDIACYSFAYGLSRCGYCHGTFRVHPKDSFAQYLIDNYGENALEKYWDYKKNEEINPWKISKCYSKKIYIKCQEKSYHESYQITCNHFVNNHRCPYCAGKKIHPLDSFAQWGIDNLGEDFLEKYWDYELNNESNIDPWKIGIGNSKYIYIKCKEKEYHPSYKIRTSHFISGSRCPYCFGHKLHILDSLGTLYPQVLKLWSDKNKKSPYEYTPKSNIEVYWKCPDDKHSDFKRKICGANNSNFICPKCSLSKGESKINDYLKINNIEYTPQKEYEELIGLKGGNLSYDFYLPQYNLLIEYQGEQHDHRVEVFHRTEYDFLKQLEHDKRKREYAENNHIELLEIWYYDYNNIEEILNNRLFT